MADKVFTVTEMTRASSSGGALSYTPTGTLFEWSSAEHSIPMEAWEIPLKLRTNRVDLPGAEEPVEQVLGWNYEPFTLTGVWDDRYMGAGAAYQTFKDFEEMVQRGNVVRLEFERVTIHGLIVSFVPRYRREDQIYYTITVSPHFKNLGQSVRAPNRNTVTDPKVAVEEALARIKAMETYQGDAGDLIDPFAKEKLKALVPSTQDKTVPLAPPFQTKDGLLDTIGSSVDQLFEVVGEAMGQVQDNVLDPLTEGSAALLRLSQRFASIKTTTQTMLTQLMSASSTAAQAYDTAISTLEFENWSRGMAAQARLAWLDANTAQKDLARRVNPQAKALYRPFKGESLYSVSQRFYGTPHEWRTIAERNGLTTITLQGTELLVIPERVI